MDLPVMNSNSRISPKNPPVVLAVSGFDPTGSAGLLADIRILNALGCYPCGVVTCETVQTSRGVSGIVPSDPEVFREQLTALIGDIRINAVKIGALASVEIIEILGRVLKEIPGVPVVLDPVFEPTRGPKFIDPNGMRAMSTHLLKQTLIATPNVHELGFPAELEVDPNDDEAITGCSMGWLSAGVETLLVTGLQRGDRIVDRFIRLGMEGQPRIDDLAHDYIDSVEIHGTGCVLSAAIAGYIASGEKLRHAVMKASEFTAGVVGNSLSLGDGARFWLTG